MASSPPKFRHSAVYWRTTIYFLAIVSVYGLGMLYLAYGPGRDYMQSEAAEQVAYFYGTEAEKGKFHEWREKLSLKHSAENDKAIVLARKERSEFIASKMTINGTAAVVDRIINRFLVIFAICLIGVVLILYLLLRLILSPLEMLIEGATRVAAGDLSFNFKSKVQSKDELGNLASVLHDLTTNFNELMNLLQNTVNMGEKNLSEIRANPHEMEKSLSEMEGLIQSMKDLIEFFGRK